MGCGQCYLKAHKVVDESMKDVIKNKYNIEAKLLGKSAFNLSFQMHHLR